MSECPEAILTGYFIYHENLKMASSQECGKKKSQFSEQEERKWMLMGFETNYPIKGSSGRSNDRVQINPLMPWTYLHLHKIVEGLGLYFHCSLSVFVSVCVSVCVCVCVHVRLCLFLPNGMMSVSIIVCKGVCRLRQWSFASTLLRNGFRTFA